MSLSGLLVLLLDFPIQPQMQRCQAALLVPKEVRLNFKLLHSVHRILVLMKYLGLSSPGTPQTT